MRCSRQRTRPAADLYLANHRHRGLHVAPWEPSALEGCTRPGPGRRDSGGFTLLEILVAVALLGGLLLAMNVFVFSMGEIWGRNSERRLFDQHVRAVTRHVENLLRSAALSPVVLNGTDAPVVPREVRLDSGATETLLTFELPEGDRVLPWPEEPLPDVVCSLAVPERRGLVLYWHSRLETRFNEEPPRATVLTPFAVSIAYDYYQPEFKSWQSQPRLQRDREGKWLAPERVTLRFAHGKMTAETSVALPAITSALPPF
jgi:prepilin-type N-terminal cleavage/methylation domain-containing protein